MSLAAIVALLTVATDPADAKRRKRYTNRASLAQGYNPPYAAIVLDAKNGSVLHAASADAARHPASLTKIMTLYLLFEQLEAGKLKLDTPMEVSEEASSQAPTKLNLKPGDKLRVEDAIKGLVTKSANDAAVVIAEHLAGGSEDEFARVMTRKARALGMKNTTYRNASGLPNDEQITTARDQALLGIAIQERFPKYYRYFSLASFVYQGHAIRNHNKLLGKVEGVDGIKTGYTRASGFNLVTSVKRGARHIVAVVLGGRSGGSRDARMRDLIDEYMVQASTKPAAPMVAEAPKVEPTPVPVPKTHQLAAADSAMMLNPARTEATAAISPGSSAPITPLKVKTVAVKIVPPRSALPSTSAPVAKSAPVRTVEPAASAQEEALMQSLAAATPVEGPVAPAPGGNVLGKLPAMIAAAKEVAIPSAKAEPAPQPKIEAVKEAAREATRAEEHFASAPRNTKGGWAIQVGAYEDEGEAKQKLSSARGKLTQVIKKAEAYIERTVKGAKTYYRARFAGFDRDQAEAACKRLKKEDVACMALKI